eukprot:4055977-Pyramimonas_sp.AAC.1
MPSSERPSAPPCPRASPAGRQPFARRPRAPETAQTAAHLQRHPSQHGGRGLAVVAHFLRQGHGEGSGAQ